jgi:CheY-like chemotaxis protein
MMSTFTEPFSVILVEDDDGHANLIKRNLQRGGVTNPITHLKSGRDAMAYFFDTPSSPFHTEKTIVVLDLNLPDIEGFEILRALKENAGTRTIPVIVLTTTDAPSDIDRCYGLGCNVFMTKPVGYEEFSEAIRKLGLMLTVVRVPYVHG